MIWTLTKRGADRFSHGHPWVFSNELTQSPKGLDPGASVELRDPAGRFLAWGYGNPHSLIAFRTLSRIAEDTAAHSAEGISKRLQSAWAGRKSMGLTNFSARIVYGEADKLPGVIIDRYVSKKSSVWVVQILTAGIEKVCDSAFWQSELQALSPGAVVLKRDSSNRKLEGLQTQETEILGAEGVDLSKFKLILGSGVELEADLVGGQKTGFFLDQWENIARLCAQIRRSPIEAREYRIVDTFSYVGHWGVALGHALKEAGAKSVVVEFWDASAPALERAKRNAESYGLRAECHEEDLIETRGFARGPLADIVIVDPPALVKNRKTVPQGRHAYVQLNTAGITRLKPDGGIYVACSCSQLLEESEFELVLSKAAHREKSKSIRWIARGGQGPDHPIALEFPEGRYLKTWIGLS